MLTTANIPLPPAAVHHGPSPGIVAIVYTVLFMSGMVATIILTNGAAYPIPTGSTDVAHHYFLRFADAVRITSFFQFGSAIPLGIFTAVITSRLRFLGIKASGVHIAMFGGFSASLLMTITGLTGWMLSQPGIADDISTMHAFQLFGFAAGGPGHIVTLGLLLAGVSVPSLLYRFIPRWLAWMGLIIAALAELSSISLIFPQAFVLLPVARFSSFIWLIGTGFTMTKKMSVSH